MLAPLDGGFMDIRQSRARVPCGARKISHSRHVAVNLRLMNRSRTSAADIVSPPLIDLAILPAPVAAILGKISAALDKDDIEALRIPIDWNEVRPLFAKSGAFAAGTDPIEILKALSFDKNGREMLRIARAVLRHPFVKITRGPVTLYEWPAFARHAAPPASDAEARTQWRCVRFADLLRSNAEGRPRATRIGIAADGVWHYFWSEG